MTKIIGNTTTTPYPRPDWDQSDATKPDYIKNRTHYVKKTEFGVTLTSFLAAELQEEGVHYYVYAYKGSSEFVPQTTTVYINGEETYCEYWSGVLYVPNGDQVNWSTNSFDANNIPIEWSYASAGVMYEEPVELPDLYVCWYECSVVPLDEKYIPSTIERISNKTHEWSDELNSDQYPAADITHARFKTVEEEKEDKSNKVTYDSIFLPADDFYGDTTYRYEEDDEHYPSVGAVLEVHKRAEGFTQRVLDEVVSGYQYKGDKVTELSEDSTDAQYPSAKAAYDAVQNKTAWELVKVKTADGEVKEAKDILAEQANILSWSFAEKYKEIYLFFKIPTLNPDNASDFPKARIMLYNADKVDTNKYIYYEQSASLSDTGVTRFVSYHIQTFGKRCEVCKKGALTETTVNAGYNQNPSSVMSVSLSKELDNPYIDKLTAYMMVSATETRYFPVDTEYEIWGVRA